MYVYDVSVYVFANANGNIICAFVFANVNVYVMYLICTCQFYHAMCVCLDVCKGAGKNERTKDEQNNKRMKKGMNETRTERKNKLQYLQ